MHTLGQLIGRFIEEMDGANGKLAVRRLGDSHRWTLRRLQRDIGHVVAQEWKKQDVIAFARSRRETVLPGTVTQDLTYLFGVLSYAPSAWEDCEEISAAAITAAKPFLIKHQLVGKSVPRERRPQPEEIERLLDYFKTPPRRGKQRTLDMVGMTLWQLYSGRRVGESCALLWEDWNREDQTILVRKMKDPKGRKKSKLVALPIEAQAYLVALSEVRDPSEPRIFPFNKKSVCAAYTHAKKILGIVNLHLHDSRRDCGTRLVEDKGYTPAQAILVTGHETVHVFERTYLKQKPKLFKLGPKGSQPADQFVPAAMPRN